jgi:hypothetical protein
MVLGVVGALALLLAIAPGATFAADGARVLPSSAQPYGQSYGAWAADWWQWVLAQPASTNPLFDDTGAQCANDQNGPVWFLAGAFTTGVTRDCAVPAGRALLVPVLNIVYCAFPEDPPDTKTEEFIRGIVDPIAASATGVFVTIDGASVAGVTGRFFEQSALFGMTLEADNVFGLPAGQVLDPCADAGYYVVVPPLPPGDHTISFGGTFPDFGGAGVDFSIDVTYSLTVG